MHSLCERPSECVSLRRHTSLLRISCQLATIVCYGFSAQPTLQQFFHEDYPSHGASMINVNERHFLLFFFFFPFSSSCQICNI